MYGTSLFKQVFHAVMQLVHSAPTSLTANTTAQRTARWLRNTNDGAVPPVWSPIFPVISNAAGGVQAVDFFAMDALGNPSNAPVTLELNGSTAAESRINNCTASNGTIINVIGRTAPMGAGNTGILVTVQPDADGRVTLAVTWNAFAIGEVKNVVIQHRWMIFAGSATTIA